MEQQQTAPDVRRIVTGHDANGKAVIWMDGPASNHKFPNPDAISTLLWSSEGSPADFLVDVDGGARMLGTAPPSHGTRLIHLQLNPGDHVPPLHRTDTLDYMILIAGELTLYLDDGVKTLMKAGDICIQRGTNHAWANHGREVARLVGVLLDGQPKRDGSIHGAAQAR